MSSTCRTFNSKVQRISPCSATCPNVNLHPLAHFLRPFCPWTRDWVGFSQPNTDSVGGRYSDQGWADPTLICSRGQCFLCTIVNFCCFLVLFFYFSFSPASNPVAQGLSWSQLCPSTPPHQYLRFPKQVIFQMTLLKCEGPGKSSHFPWNGDSGLWKILQSWSLVNGRKGGRGELGWCLNL